MSKISRYSKKVVAEKKTPKKPEKVVNFMEGTSYKVNPLLNLKLVACSSIFGESSYYRDGLDKTAGLRKQGHAISMPKKTTVTVFEEAVDKALDYDFASTLVFAGDLRNEWFMRLNPQIIFVRAMIHPKRVKFNEANPSFMAIQAKRIVQRLDDLKNQLDYWNYLHNGSKSHMPNILKKIWAEKLNLASKYEVGKYQSKGLIDLVRISHANSVVIDELMTNGRIEFDDQESTWERLKSSGKDWSYILKNIKIQHMALLRNLRGIFTEINGAELARNTMENLKLGVLNGKQFPFRYYRAYQEIEKISTINHKRMILDGLEECIDRSMENFPKLVGKTICLSDNSGSAWGGFTSEYGQTVVAEIDNLSSLITAYNSDEGEVGIFGDKLEIVNVSKRNGLLSQLKHLNSYQYKIGGGTENGIWLFFEQAIKQSIHYDNIFIYSDQQAGHGGLYGVNPRQYSQYKYKSTPNIDVLALVREYRAKVNAKVNVFSVQTAGYDNSVLPEYEYRTAILTGWTGKEAFFAKKVIDIWNQME